MEVIKMLKKLSTPNAIFTMLQGMTVLISAAGVFLAWMLLRVGFAAVEAGAAVSGLPQPGWWTLLIAGFASVIIVSVACAVALYTFFFMCSRIKRATAFTRENERAMGRIALCCLVAGLTLAAACAALQIAHVTGLFWFQMGVMAFAFLAVSMVAWALCLLVRRAVTLQEEADLTV